MTPVPDCRCQGREAVIKRWMGSNRSRRSPLELTMGCAAAPRLLVPAALDARHQYTTEELLDPPVGPRTCDSCWLSGGSMVDLASPWSARADDACGMVLLRSQASPVQGNFCYQFIPCMLPACKPSSACTARKVPRAGTSTFSLHAKPAVTDVSFQAKKQMGSGHNNRQILGKTSTELQASTQTSAVQSWGLVRPLAGGWRSSGTAPGGGRRQADAKGWRRGMPLDGGAAVERGSGRNGIHCCGCGPQIRRAKVGCNHSWVYVCRPCALRDGSAHVPAFTCTAFAASSACRQTIL